MEFTPPCIYAILLDKRWSSFAPVHIKVFCFSVINSFAFQNLYRPYKYVHLINIGGGDFFLIFSSCGNVHWGANFSCKRVHEPYGNELFSSNLLQIHIQMMIEIFFQSHMLIMIQLQLIYYLIFWDFLWRDDCIYWQHHLAGCSMPKL